MPSFAFGPPCPFIRRSVSPEASTNPKPSVIALNFCRLWWMVVSCRITSIFSETSRNLDVHLSVENLGLLPECGCFNTHFRNILEYFLLDVYLQAVVHRIWGNVFIQPSLQISSDIISPGGDAYSHYSSGKAIPDFVLNVRSSSHEYSSAWRLCGFGLAI